MIVEAPATGTWTVQDLERIDTGDFRLELDEGQLLVTPAAWLPWNSRVALRLAAHFDAQQRPNLLEAGVQLPSGARTPDLGVFAHEPDEVAYHRADEFVIAIEIVSESTALVDYEVKPAKYAEGGIPEYWIVDRHPDDPHDALVKIHHLTGGEGNAVYRLERTVPLSILELE